MRGLFYLKTGYTTNTYTASSYGSKTHQYKRFRSPRRYILRENEGIRLSNQLYGHPMILFLIKEIKIIK